MSAAAWSGQVADSELDAAQSTPESAQRIGYTPQSFQETNGGPLKGTGALKRAFCLIGILVAAACSDRSETGDEAEAADHSTMTDHAVHWTYEEATGPAKWAELNPEYAICGNGREQSPIDIRDAEEIVHVSVPVDYEPASVRIIRHEHVVDLIDNGHTIQVNYDEGSVVTVDGIDFELEQYHFHAPSEHTIDGRHAPMEMHLVHTGPAGDFAVFGILIERGEHNAAFEPLWGNLPSAPGEERHYENIEVDVDDLLPQDLRSYRYAGSLTTPPCSEGVRWFVAVVPIELSGEQIAAFTSIIDNNNRPVQTLGDRTVFVEVIQGE